MIRGYVGRNMDVVLKATECTGLLLPRHCSFLHVKREVSKVSDCIAEVALSLSPICGEGFCGENKAHFSSDLQ